MPWTSLPTLADGSAPSAADLNAYLGNIEYLRKSNGYSYVYTGADLTTTSTTFASLGANWEANITTYGGRLLAIWCFSAKNVMYDFEVDGVRRGNTVTGDGSGEIRTGVATVMLPLLLTNLSPGNHTIKCVWRAPSSLTATIYGSAAPRFFVREI